MLHDLLGALGWVSSAFGRAWLELAPYLGAAYVGIWLDRRLSRSRKVLPVGYRNPLIRVDLADEIGEEFDGMWIMLRNPRLQTQETLTPPDVTMGEDGTPSVADAMNGMRTVVARLVYDWNLPDPADPREDAEPLPIRNQDDHRTRGPAVEDVAKIPGAVVLLIGERIRQAVAPH